MRSYSIKMIRLAEVDSTNRYLLDHQSADEEWMTVVRADFQSAGRGLADHSWESEAGKNLLFSILLHPKTVVASSQFLLSATIALAVRSVLGQYLGDITVKWPNDIYWKDDKIGGILIENRLSATHIKDCVIGVGLNVNQQKFRSDAPNPVSLSQITRKEYDLDVLLRQILNQFSEFYRQVELGQGEAILEQYQAALYRKKGFHPYQDAKGKFEAELMMVEGNGTLVLRDRDRRERRYAFKEVRYLLDTNDNKYLFNSIS